MKNKFSESKFIFFFVSILIVMEVENEEGYDESVYNRLETFQSLLLWKSKMKLG